MDREKVISGLRDIDMFIAGRFGHEKAKKFLRTIDETIAMLKEQEKPNGKCVNECECWDSAYERGKQDTLKEQEAVEPFHKCIGKEFSLIEDSHFDYCPYCGKPITWAKQEGR